MNMALRNKPLEDWEEVVLRLHQEHGLTYQQIGVQLHVSAQRIGEICRQARERLKDFAENGDDALSRLPARVRQLVVQLGIGSRALTRAAIESGRLSWSERYFSIQWDGVYLPNVRDKTWLILHEWVGLPRPELRPRYVARTAQRRRRQGRG